MNTDRQLPATLVEQELLNIWEQVLQVRPAGVTDNFFALGGDSLRAMQVRVRLRATWGVAVALRDLFEHPTVRALAAHVETLRAARAAKLVTGTI